MIKIIKIIFLVAAALLITQPSIFAAVDTTSGASEVAPAPAKPPAQPAQPTPQEQQSTLDLARLLPALEATEDIMPDNSLYSVKLIIEDMFTELTTGKVSKAEILLSFSKRRADEAAYLHSIGSDMQALAIAKNAVDLLSDTNSSLEEANRGRADDIQAILLEVSAAGERVVSLLKLIAPSLGENDDWAAVAADAQKETVRAIVINAAVAVGDVNYDSETAFELAMASYLLALQQRNPDPVQVAFDALVTSGLLEKEAIAAPTSQPSRYYYDDDDDDDRYEHEDDDDDD